jgi:hypothetical protein
VNQHGRDAVLTKVQIRLVSNQPADPILEECLAAASAWARQAGPDAQRGTMLRDLPRDHSDVIRRIAEAIDKRLTSGAFCDFLTVLDLSEVGALERGALANSVRAGAATLSPGRGSDSALRLFDLVRQQALPESRRTGIAAADVLATLGVADVLDLYPAPARLPELRDPLPAPGARAVAEAIAARPGGFVIAHGPAGAGKTTALRQVVGHLPTGSVVLLYDCYGGGEYLNTGEERHPAQRFVMQVVNEVAQRCGTPLLLHPPQAGEDLWRVFSRTLTRAVESLAPGALLVLAVDAADNAAVAAAERGDGSFLPGLLGLQLPPRVVVVLTARSHRVEMISAAGAAQVQIAAFDESMSSAHLRRHWRNASEAEGAAFHERTGGNARVQFYVLDQAASHEWGMPELLDACARTPEPFFKDLVDAAIQGSGVEASGQRWLALMLALTRPVSTQTLADAVGVAPEVVAAFASGLTPGVEVTAGAIQFRDEDFEAYVRSRVDPRDVVLAHGHLADLFLACRTEDPDAAAFVVDHLFAAGRLGEVLQLVLDERFPRGIPDGFRREQVQGRRLDLALQAAATTDDAAVPVRIAAIACDTASRLDTLSQLVESRLDMVARHVDVDLLRAHALRQARGGWLAPIHMRLAAALAKDPERHTSAREALESADAWLRRWAAGRDAETRSWDVGAEDVARAAEAYFRLDGLDAAVSWLRRWQPADFARDAAVALAARVAGEVGLGEMRGALLAAKVSAAAQAPFLAFAASPTAPADPAWIDDVVAALLATTPGKGQAWHVRMLDATVRYGNRESAAALAQHWAQELPSYPWAFSSRDGDGIAALRCHAAASALTGTELDVDSLVPALLRPTETKTGVPADPRAHDRGEWREKVGPLADIAVLAARAAAGDNVSDAVAAKIDGVLTGRLKSASHRWFKSDTSFRAWAALAAEAAIDVQASPQMLDRIAGAAPALVRDGAPWVWLDLAELFAKTPRHQDRAADLCVRVATAARTGAYAAPDRLDLLASAADIAGVVAPALGRQLFDYAVDAATGINDDAARLLSVHAELAHRAALPADERRRVAIRLVRAAEDATPYVTDTEVVPYKAVASAAAGLDVAVGLAAVTRWDDEDRVPMHVTLPAAIIGAVDGSGIAAAEALALDHLIEDDDARLDLQLAVVARMPSGTAGTTAARLALLRCARQLRRHVPARLQPVLAGRLLKAARGRGLDAAVCAELEEVRARGLHRDELSGPATPRGSWLGGDPSPKVLTLLDAPERRGWETLHEDIELLTETHVYGERLRSFVRGALRVTPPAHRLDALAALDSVSESLRDDTFLPVLAEFVGSWSEWPGVREWAAAVLPKLFARQLGGLAWRDDTEALVEQLRAFAPDDAIRRAILSGLPEARPRLSARGWQNVAAILGRLCPPAEAANALVGLLGDRDPEPEVESITARVPDLYPEPLLMLLWSHFGHPRRDLRWRAAHVARELLTSADPTRAVALTAGLVGCLSLTDAGLYRDPRLHFYNMSAVAALLAALARVSTEKPGLLAPHAEALIGLATGREFPHAQIRELARTAALAITSPLGSAPETLRLANQPSACLLARESRYRLDDRRASDGGRYRFDAMDTVPYWYFPLARVFGVPVDTVCELAERWIVDAWGFGEGDWMTDARELRDERSWGRMHNDHGSIPPVESLRLYLEYHAMMTAAGSLVDAGKPIVMDSWEDAPDSWIEWLGQSLPASSSRWLADLRSPVPIDAESFDEISPLDAWNDPSPHDYDRVIGLVEGSLPEWVVVAAGAETSRPDGYAGAYVTSALVGPDHADDLRRAIAAASYARDLKLPSEGDEEYETEHGRFVLRGWLSESTDYAPSGTLEEHDPYAHVLRKNVPLPGRVPRQASQLVLDPAGFALLAQDGTAVAHAEQWSDPSTEDRDAVTTSGYRVCVERSWLLRYLRETNTNLIVEVLIGRHRHDVDSGEYRPDRNRVYLIDAAGRVTVR